MRQTFDGFAYKPSLSFISGIGPNGKHVDSDAFHVGEANCQHMGKWVDDIGMLDHKCSETPLPRILSVQGPIWWGALHGDGATVNKGKTRLILVSTTLGNEKQNLFHKLPPPKSLQMKASNKTLNCYWPFYWVATDFSNPVRQKLPKAVCWDISWTSMEYIAGNTVVVGLNMRVGLKPDPLKSSGQPSAFKT